MRKTEKRMIGIFAAAGFTLLILSGILAWKTTAETAGEWAKAAEEQYSEQHLRMEAVSEYESETESETETETETGTETELDSATETNQETERVTEAESELPTETVIGTEIEHPTESTTEPELPTEPEIETELSTETVIGTELEHPTESTTESEIPTETEVETELPTETVIGTELEHPTENTTENTTEVETEQPTETEIGTEIGTDAEEPTESETETQTETEKKELLPTRIERGRHYDVKGDTGAWYRDKQNQLWVRKGTNLYIETKQDGGFDGRGLGMQNLQQDGVMTFQLQKTDTSGAVTAVSEVKQEQFFVDGEAPEAVIVLEGNQSNGMIHTAQQAQAGIQIPPDGKSGLKSAEYCIVDCLADGTLTQKPEQALWQSCENGETILVQTEGIFRIYVRTQDQVGNQGFSQSAVVCVDRTPPELTVEGVKDQTANSETVQIKVSCTDTYYREGSLEVQMTGANNGRSPKLRKQEETEQGAHVTYLDFPVSKEYDDVYQLQVKASDLAGNQAEQTMTFSINRFGSVYDLSEDTKKGLEKYYLKQAQPITFYETNIDYVGESEIFCRRDGSLVQLKRGQDYQVSMQGSSDSWKQYQYVIPAEYFDREGVYELQLSSTDRANNQSDTGIQQKRVVFVLDRTAPGCTITGVKSGTVYERETLTVCIAPYDNFGVAQMKIYADSELLKSSKMKAQENIKLTMRAKHQWQTLQIYICDQAGNEYWSEEIPFYIKADDIEVEPYEKVRESAEEKEMRKKLEAVSFLNGFSFSLVRQMDPILHKKTMSEEAATEKEDEIARNAAEPEEKIQQEQSEKETKAGFLAVGAVVFLVTVVVLFVDIFRQLWYDAP